MVWLAGAAEPTAGLEITIAYFGQKTACKAGLQPPSSIGKARAKVIRARAADPKTPFKMPYLASLINNSDAHISTSNLISFY
jgi:hypothetical protein